VAVMGASQPLVRVRKLDHIAIRCADPERTASWYIAVLGLDRRLEEAFGNGSPVTVGAGECALSIFPGTEPSFEHLAFEIGAHELTAAADVLDAHGIVYRRADHGIARSLYLTDPDGCTVELTAYITEEPNTMADDPKHVVTRIVEDMFNRHDLAAADGYVATDCIDHSGFPGQPAGLAGMKTRWGMMFAAFPDFCITIDDLIAEDDKVSMRATGRGTHQGEFFGVPATGKPVVFTEINLSRVVDGRMVEHWAERSTLEVLRQIGAVQ
jgi:predicted ester cyclase/catechol 2,3-dioxygenase-like lactoylglutathione lyase family enzyme